MPMFEFVCRECGAPFEELCSRAEADSGRVECPRCGAKKAEKQMSSFATSGDGSGGGLAGGGCGAGGFT